MKKKGFLIMAVIAVISVTMAACGGLRDVVATTEGERPQEDVGPSPVQETEESATEPIEEPTDTQAPEPTDIPAPELSLEIVDQNNYTSSIGTLHFIGILENSGSVAAEFVEILVSLRDADNKLIDSTFSFSMLNVMEPGDRSPFQVSFIEPPDDWENYEIAVQADEAGFIETYTDFEILSAEGSETGYGAYEIDGEVNNTGDSAAEFVEIIAALYDAEGRIIGTEFTFTKLDKVPAGGSSPFTVSALQTAEGSVDHFDLWVQGSISD